MRNMSVYVLLFVLAFFRVGVHAQGPDLHLAYYEQSTPNRLDADLLFANICLEEVLRVNGPDFDFVNIEYGDSFWLPRDPRECYYYDPEQPYGWWNFSDGYPPRLKFYENGEWLEEPYYSDEVVYLRAETIADLVAQTNVCEDVLLAENILLHHFDLYKDYPIISMDIFVPRDAPPCDPDLIGPPPDHLQGYIVVKYPQNELSPLRLVEDHNVCMESLNYSWFETFYLTATDKLVSIPIPEDAPPCYNGAGQRLTYYDMQGVPLEEPVYSDLPVFIVPVGWSIEMVAMEHAVCLLDLLRVNHFPVLPVNVPVELFIPPARPCPDEGLTYVLDGRQTTDVMTYSALYDICPELLLHLNPQFRFNEYRSHWLLENPYYANPRSELWLVIPAEWESCYTVYEDRTLTNIFEIEQALNICHQEFFGRYNYWTYNPYTSLSYDIPLHIEILYRRDIPPCYNEAGQRLAYNRFSHRPIMVNGDYPAYSPLPVHLFTREDTAYSVARQYNVCVEDLLAENPILVGRMPTGLAVFIPQTRPCYDEATGHKLIYEDESGAALPVPQVAESLIHYGDWMAGYLSSYYNVCRNRIQDANQAKFDREVSYLGWIIPTDRPDCYDMDGYPIDYVCYDTPLNPEIDYRQTGNAPTFSYDGTDCHDIFAPETVVWYEDQPYKALRYENTLFQSRAFTAWCYGVSLAAIDAVNAHAAMVELLPLKARFIPQPTRECYLDHPERLADKAIYSVKRGDTLYSIAQEMGKPYQWLAWVNGLDADNSIWPRQALIIPHWREVLLPLGVIFGLGGVGIMLYWRQRRKRTA